MPILLPAVAACGPGGFEPEAVRAPPEPTVPDTPPDPIVSGAPVPKFPADGPIRVLLLGNSHVVGLDGIIEALFEHSRPERFVEAERGPFQPTMREHWQSAESRRALETGNWTHVILQGQRYSQSETTLFPTDFTRAFIARAKERGMVPILFPEHPQRGRMTEAQYIHTIHEGIAQEEPACLAPVGLAWDRVLAEPEIPSLHDTDGNHASLAGRVLTAVMLHDVLAGSSTDALSGAEVRVADEDLALFEEAVGATLSDRPPCP